MKYDEFILEFVSKPDSDKLVSRVLAQANHVSGKSFQKEDIEEWLKHYLQVHPETTAQELLDPNEVILSHQAAPLRWDQQAAKLCGNESSDPIVSV